MGPGILAAAITSGKIKRPLTWGNVGINENTHPEISFLFLQMKTIKDENPLQYKKERIKVC